MPNISFKGINMPESPIRKLVPFSEIAKKKGKEVIHLNIGQPDIKPPEQVIKKINNFNISKIEYSHSAGMEKYREGIADYYQKNNLNILKEDILITTGGSEALIFTINSISDPGDEIIIPEPFYANYNGFSKLANVEIKPVVSNIEDGFRLPEIDSFEKAITKKTKAILICNPNNPTGYLYTKNEINILAKIAKKYDIFLIADEVYREFIYDENKHYSILSEKDISQNAIVIDSTSKRYSMCGARVGCIVSKNKNLIKTCLKFAQARLSPPTFGQLAGISALQTNEEYFNNVISEYQERRNLLVAELNKINGVICPMPKGAFYCIAKLPIENADDFCKWILKDFDVKNTTLMMAPASGFYSTKNTGNNEVRIAYVLEKNKILQACDILNKGLKKYKQL
tara:strand:+ start:5550 stop:6743 length:1194 start_codon:yes stop_codon:yes gene_type:complete